MGNYGYSNMSIQGLTLDSLNAYLFDTIILFVFELLQCLLAVLEFLRLWRCKVFGSLSSIQSLSDPVDFEGSSRVGKSSEACGLSAFFNLSLYLFSIWLLCGSLKLKKILFPIWKEFFLLSSPRFSPIKCSIIFPFSFFCAFLAPFFPPDIALIQAFEVAFDELFWSLEMLLGSVPDCSLVQVLRTHLIDHLKSLFLLLSCPLAFLELFAQYVAPPLSDLDISSLTIATSEC